MSREPASVMSVSVADAIPLGDESVLVPIGIDDADELYHLVAAERVSLAPWLLFARDATLETTHRFIASAIAQSRVEAGFHFGIRRGGAIVGMIAISPIDQRNRVGTIGYWLCMPARGRGLMTRAARALISWAISALKLNRIEIRIHPENARSRAIAQRLGFVCEGRLSEARWTPEGPADVDLFALVARRWRRAAGRVNAVIGSPVEPAPALR